MNFFMKSLTISWNFFNSVMSLISWVASAFNALIVFEIYSYLSVKWVRCGWFIFKSFSCFFILASRLSWCFWRRLPKPTSSLFMSLKVLRPCRSVNYYDRSSIVLLIIMVHIRKHIQKIIKVKQMLIGNGSGLGGSGISSDSSVGILYLWKNLLTNLPSKFSKIPPSLVVPTFYFDLF